MIDIDREMIHWNHQLSATTHYEVHFRDENNKLVIKHYTNYARMIKQIKDAMNANPIAPVFVREYSESLFVMKHPDYRYTDES